MKDKHLLIVAVILGALAVVLVNRKIGEYEKKANVRTTSLYRATVDIDAGALSVQGAVSRNYLVPVRQVPLTFAQGYPEVVRGTSMRAAMPMKIHRRIRAGEFLHHFHLQEVSAASLQKRIPPGKMLMTLQVTRMGTIAYFVRPGDVVDFYQVRSVTDSGQRGGNRRDVVKIASRVRILAADNRWATDKASAEGERGQPYSIVTIAVEEPLFKKLLLESGRGPITFGLVTDEEER